MHKPPFASKLTRSLAAGAVAASFALTPACATPAQAAPKGKASRPAAARPLAPTPLDQVDPVMAAAVAELARNATTLRLPEYDAPYYLAYSMKQLEQKVIGGKLGALIIDDESKKREAAVDVRVGDYRFDSSEDAEGDWPDEGMLEPSTSLPLEDRAEAIRHTLWLLTDLRYKQALSSYLKLKGQRVYSTKLDKKRPSFTQVPPVLHADPVPPLTMDRARWQRMVRELSAQLAADPEVFDSEVQVSFHLETRWLATSEGARLRTVQPIYAFHATAYTRAPDGMLLDQSVNLYAPTEAGLPPDDALRERIGRLVADLAALRAAPVLDPYTGPAILEPAATGVFFHEVLGHRLEGHRQDGNEEGQTFTAHLNHGILPPFLSIYDDPTLTAHEGTPLNGTYLYDDEAVAAQRVALVEGGVLKSFLMTRRPVEGFSASNGHARGQGTARPVARMGNLIVQADAAAAVDNARLKQMLLEEARRQGKPFGLLIRDITGGSTNTSSYGFQAFKGQARMVYKVDAQTGEETLVRGVELVGTPLISLGKIVAASRETGIFNGYCGAESGMVPVSTVAPSTLFSEIELQRSMRVHSKGPILAPPLPSRSTP